MTEAAAICARCGKWRALKELTLSFDVPPLLVCKPEANCSCAPVTKPRQVWLNGPDAGHEVGREPPPADAQIRDAIVLEQSIQDGG